jgi:hypothetical protein
MTLYSNPTFWPNQIAVAIAFAEVPERANPDTALIGDFANATFRLCRTKLFRIDSPLKDLPAVAFPDVEIGIWVSVLKIFFFLAKDLRKPGIVFPIDENHNSVSRGMLYKALW